MYPSQLHLPASKALLPQMLLRGGPPISRSLGTLGLSTRTWLCLYFLHFANPIGSAPQDTGEANLGPWKAAPSCPELGGRADMRLSAPGEAWWSCYPGFSIPVCPSAALHGRRCIKLSFHWPLLLCLSSTLQAFSLKVGGKPTSSPSRLGFMPS